MTKNLLISDLQKAAGKRLKHASGFGHMPYTDGGSAYEKLVLGFDELQIAFSVDQDTDELIVQITTEIYDNFIPVEPMKNYIGHDLGWSWISENSGGYRDVAMFSFEGPIPQIMFATAASMLGIYTVSPA